MSRHQEGVTLRLGKRIALAFIRGKNQRVTVGGPRRFAISIASGSGNRVAVGNAGPVTLEDNAPITK